MKDLHLERSIIKTHARGPKIMSTKIYNKLPSPIKKIDNINKFKKEAFNFLLEKYYYSVHEYLSGK